MALVFECPSCKSQIKAEDRHASKFVRCPGCRESIFVPPLPECTPTPPPPAIAEFLSPARETGETVAAKNEKKPPKPECSICGKKRVLNPTVDGREVCRACLNTLGSDFKLATPRQIEYAKKLSYAVTDRSSLSSVSTLLDQHDQMKTYVGEVWVRITNVWPTHGGISSDEYNRVTAELVKDRPLAEYVMKLQDERDELQEISANDDEDGEKTFREHRPPLRRDFAYDKVAAFLRKEWAFCICSNHSPAGPVAKSWLVRLFGG